MQVYAPKQKFPKESVSNINTKTLPTGLPNIQFSLLEILGVQWQIL
jgi:hypothetical protein